MTFAASATLILGALWVPAVIISLYKLSTIFAISGFEPDVIFLIFVIVCFYHLDLYVLDYNHKKNLY